MKKISYFTGVLFLIACQPTQEEIAQKIINDYCTEQSKIDGYKPIIFSSLDSAFTSFENTSVYKRYSNLKKISEFIKYSDEQYDNLMQEIWYKDSIPYYEHLCDSLKSIFIPEFIGWKMEHIYKSVNDKDEEFANHFIFYFDKDLTRMVDTELIYKELWLQTYEQAPVFYGIT
jgi:hypothetical protein